MIVQPIVNEGKNFGVIVVGAVGGAGLPRLKEPNFFLAPCFRKKPLGSSVICDHVILAVRDEKRAFDPLRAALQREATQRLSCIRLGVCAHDPLKLPAQRRVEVVNFTQGIVATEMKHTGFDPLFVGGGPRAVIAAHAEAEKRDAPAIQVLSALQKVDNSSNRLFVIGTRQDLLKPEHSAPSGPVDDDARAAARQRLP